jgi:uncharacterized DUF497 family protein
VLPTKDTRKNAWNIRECGLPFEMVNRLDWTSILLSVDARKPYPEPRYRVLGSSDGEVLSVVIAFESDEVRVISLPKANRKESRLWHASRTPT